MFPVRLPGSDSPKAEHRRAGPWRSARLTPDISGKTWYLAAKPVQIVYVIENNRLDLMLESPMQNNLKFICIYVCDY